MPSRFYASFDGNLTSDVKFGKTRKGDRKAEFTIAHSSYLTDENGDSNLSGQDLAVALVDEIETPTHRRTRFTVAY